MERYFNIGGPCLPAKHYMLPAMARLPKVEVKDGRRDETKMAVPREK